MKKELDYNTHNLQIVKVFLVGVAGIILISISMRITVLFAKSKFESNRIFSVQISSEKKKKDMVTYTLTFNPEKKSLTVLSIVFPNNKQNELGINQKEFYTTVGKYIKIPLDELIMNAPIEFGEKKERETVDSELLTLLFSYNSYRTELTIIDIFRMWWFARSVSNTNVSFEKIQLPLDDHALDTILSRIFTDSVIEEENQDIEIINSTEVSGLANRLARLITNMGGNVVSITTSKNPSNTSKILVSNKKKYTSERLHTILGFGVEEGQTQSIADVIIVIGKDKLSSLPF